MADQSKIEWTDATWNPIVGCSVVSPGCTNCYAMRQAPRTDALSIGAPWAGKAGKLTQSSKAGPVWTGAIRFVERRLAEPMTWRKPRMIFVNSMGDLFHESIPDEWIDKVIAVMALCPQHTFQVLTKRPERMREYFFGNRFMPVRERIGHEICNLGLARALPPALSLAQSPWLELSPWPLPNVWLGVSCERQEEADERIPHLLQTPAAVRFVSCEPLLGPIELTSISHTAAPGYFGDALKWHHIGKCHEDEGVRYGGIDWVIAGGESSPNARPMHPDWARSLRDQCEAAGVSFFFKQWGEFAPFPLKQPPINPRKFYVGGKGYDYHLIKGRPEQQSVAMVRLGKKGAGRKLDGREHNNFPKVAA